MNLESDEIAFRIRWVVQTVKFYRRMTAVDIGPKTIQAMKGAMLTR